MPGLAHSPAPPGAAWETELADAVTDLAWTEAGTLAAGSADGRIAWLGDDTGLAAGALEAHRGGITRLRAQPRGSLLASAGEDGCLRLWGAGGTCELLAEEREWIEHLDWTPDGRTLAAAIGPRVRLWRDGVPLDTRLDAGRRVLGLAWSPDGRRLAGAANKGLFRWDARKPDPEQLLAFPGAPVSLGWSHTGSALAAGTQDGFLQVWRRDRKGAPRQLSMKGYPGKVACLAWDPRRDAVATAGGGEVVIWRFFNASGQRATPLRHHAKAVTALAYAPDGALLVSGDREGRVCLWSGEGRLHHELFLDGEITAVAWSRQGRLAVGTAYGLIQAIDVRGAGL